MHERYEYLHEFIKTQINTERWEKKKKDDHGEEERESSESVRRGEDYQAIELAYFLQT